MYPRGVLSPEDPVKTMRFESASQAPGLTRHDAAVLRHAGEDLIGDTGDYEDPPETEMTLRSLASRSNGRAPAVEDGTRACARKTTR
jgi:hypothetical protein